MILSIALVHRDAVRPSESRRNFLKYRMDNWPLLMRPLGRQTPTLSKLVSTVWVRIVRRAMSSLTDVGP